MSQTYFYNLVRWDRPNSKVRFILKTHTQNKWNSCLLSLKNDKKHLARGFFPPIIYPNTASSETKQLEAEI